MDREKQIEEMAKDLAYSIVWDDEDLMTVDSYKTALALRDKGYRKASEFTAEFSEAVKHISEGVKFKNATEKTAFIEMLDDLTRVKMKGGE